MTDCHKSARIDLWWKAFIDKAPKILDTFCNRANFDVAGFMQKNLSAIDNNLMWEFGPALNLEGHRLVITPENCKHLRPLVTEILRRAPKLHGWEFYPYRLPENFELAKTTVEARTGTTFFDFFFTGEINDFNQVDLTFIALNARDEETERLAFHQAFIMVENFLGEEVLDKWVGAIEISNSLPQNGSYKPVSELETWVSEQINVIKDRLPDKPFFERVDNGEWSLFKIDPPEKQEYPRQEDMFVGKTMCTPLWQNAHSRVSFNSERFSKLGETFCYLKLDGREGVDSEQFVDKSQIEDALDDALIGAKLGCHIGGGTGLHFSYIDLALTDLDKGIVLVKNILRNGKITKKSWIQFFDSEYEAEWVGIWDDSPAPPMPNFEERR